jgi:XTP/dITP diphosphohydrolase
MTRTIVIASRNFHKIDEIREILGSRWRYLTLRDLPAAPEVVEDGATFTANATKKAVQTAEWFCSSGFLAEDEKGWVLADDSGLEVDALNQAPGVHSARFAAIDTGAEGNSSDAENNEKLLRLMAHVGDAARTARFRCVLAVTPVSGSDRNAPTVCQANELELATQIFEGKCEGHILKQERGMNGFGYDPLFVPNGYGQTFAQLGDAVKNRLSHRAQALSKARAKIFV